MFTFVAGAGFSITQGGNSIIQGEQAGDFAVSYVVLGSPSSSRAASLLNGIKQVRGKAERWRVRPVSYLRQTSDTSVRAVVFEDVSALIGLVLAAVGLALTELTGSGVWDGLSSVAIGLLLLVVVAAKVDFRDAVSSGDIEEACGRAEQHLTTRWLWLDRRVGPSGPAASGLWGRDAGRSPRDPVLAQVFIDGGRRV